MMEKHGTADFYFAADTALFRPKRVYVFVEGEYGFIPLIVSKSIEGKQKPMVEVISEHQCIDAFNQMPKLLNPSWTMTQIDKSTVVVSITNWWPLNVDLHSNPDMWSHAYPMIRDIILGLKAHGCEALTFFTCMNNQEATDNPEIMVYDMHNDIRPREDLVLTPPAWIFPFLADRMGLRASVVAVTQDEGHFVDERALSLSRDFFVALGHTYDDEKAQDTLSTVKGMEENLNMQRFMVDDDDEGGWLA
jgi:hypothetical protein